MPAKKATQRKKRSNGESPRKTPPKQITFFYVRGPDFRTVHVDGAIGGITPRGFLHIALFSERPAIPQEVVQKVSPTGTLGDEVQRTGKEGIVRQMEVDVVMSESAVLDLRDWLNKALDDFERRKALVASRQETSH